MYNKKLYTTAILRIKVSLLDNLLETGCCSDVCTSEMLIRNELDIHPAVCGGSDIVKANRFCCDKTIIIVFFPSRT